ncbi:hypothetical protein D4R75_15890, partial [bacterium]
MIEFLNILATPGETFDRIKDKPRWRITALLCAGTLFVLIWLGGCWHNLSDAFTASYLIGPALISPLIIGIVSVGSTMFLFLMNMVVGGRTSDARRFKTLFSLNIHCAPIILLGEVINFLLVRANILGESSSLLPNRFPVGLDLILLAVDEPNVYTAILLHSTSCFVVWYLVVLARGITTITESSRRRSALIVVSLWLAVVATALSLAYVTGGGT